MIVRDMIEQANLLATGSKSAVSASQQAKTLMIANLLQRDWQDEVFSQPDKRWNSLKQTATINLSQDTHYNLESGFLGIAHRSDFKINDQVVTPVYNIRNSQIIFDSKFVKENTDKTLTYEFYRELEPLSDLGQTIQIDNPNWLVYMVAGELVRPDPVMGHQYANLIAMAQSAMQSMKRRDAIAKIPDKMQVRRLR